MPATSSYRVVVENSPFPAVERASAVYDALQPLCEVIAGDPALADASGASLRAEVLPRRTPAGALELSRCYWSVQRPDPDSAFGFSARTMFWDRRTRDARVLEFPEDPVMDWLVTSDGALTAHGEQATRRVLRYIPLRRVTFLLERAPGLPDRVIAKTKRRRSIVRAARALLSARRAVERGGGRRVHLPEPVRLDAGRRLLYLAVLPGRTLSELLAAGEIDRDAALHRLGRLHREVHELDVRRGARARQRGLARHHRRGRRADRCPGALDW